MFAQLPGHVMDSDDVFDTWKYLFKEVWNLNKDDIFLAREIFQKKVLATNHSSSFLWPLLTMLNCELVCHLQLWPTREFSPVVFWRDFLFLYYTPRQTDARMLLQYICSYPTPTKGMPGFRGMSWSLQHPPSTQPPQTPTPSSSSVGPPADYTKDLSKSSVVLHLWLVAAWRWVVLIVDDLLVSHGITSEPVRSAIPPSNSFILS